MWTIILKFGEEVQDKLGDEVEYKLGRTYQVKDIEATEDQDLNNSIKDRSRRKQSKNKGGSSGATVLGCSFEYNGGSFDSKTWRCIKKTWRSVKKRTGCS
ncbi:hypothetical protein L1987_46093 [Smallanthus sonchifolius]|uniref:Uncharacterized protein n=1 Tax=Smallanthus sonchifolius TaxID=185202 RepID=A0ACB9FYT0_9ASTR|nr:hypothetical protein L1987_46093 [Smallanthus sonchifolius]